MNGHRFSGLILLSVVQVFSTAVLAQEVFRYPEATHGKGALKYIAEVPVLLVEGSPEEIGEQLGVLALGPASPLTKLGDELLEANGWQQVYAVILKTGNILLPQFPADHLKELDAAAKASGWPRDLLVFGNTVPDLRKLTRCSALIVDAQRSVTGGPLFGRNLDWPPIGPLHEYTLVVVCRPTGKRSFASITYPGMLGCFSGLNDAGLALADLTVNSAKDGSVKLNPFGTPYALALRRVLEECATVQEAENLLRSLKRTVSQNVAICDPRQGAVFEITPKSLVVRRPVEGICACTNHFRTKQLSTSQGGWRYDLLAQSRQVEQLSVADVAGRMDAVNQGAATLQTMVFEPSALRLHLAFGKGPATRLPLRTVDLSDLLKKEVAP